MKQAPVRQRGQTVVRGQELNPFLRVLFLRNVASDAAITGESTSLVKHRFATDPDMVDCCIRKGASHYRVAKRLVLLEQRGMRVPATFDLEAKVPERLADFTIEGGAVAGNVLPFHAGKAKSGILFPKPLGRRLGQAAESL